MSSIRYVERDMTKEELDRMYAGIDEHTLLHGRAILQPERHGFVILDGETFIGCSSGLIYKRDAVPIGWFYLTDLFVELPYRGKGLGRLVLQKLEDRVRILGCDKIWVWTAAHEAPGFYQKQGYEIVCEMEDYYAQGASRIALRKNL